MIQFMFLFSASSRDCLIGSKKKKKILSRPRRNDNGQTHALNLDKKTRLVQFYAAVLSHVQIE